MLGIDCMKRKIPSGGFCFCFFLLHLHCWFGICCREGNGGGGGLRLWVNIVKCRMKECHKL